MNNYFYCLIKKSSLNIFTLRNPIKKMSIKKIIVIFLLLFNISLIFPQNYSDQFYEMRIDSMNQNIEAVSGIKLSDDGKSFVLEDSVLSGYVIIKSQSSVEPFNEGLPSWNGTAPDDSSSFKIQMRFPYGSSWSPWLTVGFWKANIWSSYGQTSYGGGYIDYDNVKLNTYQSSWQFKVIFGRKNINNESPSLDKLSFFVSDSRTTTSINYTQILNDNPPQILIPTDFIYQYNVDPIIGPDICSPTSTSMALRSYNIQVDPYQFALDNYDPYFEMFGIWPRAVQNAAEYGMNGAVTRYRNWSDCYKVLANNGRIVMSIGAPLYTGHLVMLAGFTSTGNPIVHDPARTNGYSYVYNKSSISHSWFDKGGVGYTFYDTDSIFVNIDENNLVVNNFKLNQNYPNPFNPITKISFTIPTTQFVNLKVYDVLGNEVEVLLQDEVSAGNYVLDFDGTRLSSGVYIYTIQTNEFLKSLKMILLK